MEARIKSPRRSLTSSDHSLLLITCLNPIIRTQNKAENQWRTAKRLVNKFMNSSGCPPSAWLLCLQYVCVLINHMSSPAMDGLPPLHALTGQTPDISFLLQFSFWEPVHHRVNPNEPSSNFPSISNERKGYWVVSLTMLETNFPGKFSLRIPTTLSSDLRSGVSITSPLIFVMSCLQGRAIFLTPTLTLMKIHQTSLTRILWNQSECEDNSSLNPNPTPMATFIVDDLIGRFLLLPSGQDSHKKTRATVTKKIEELDQDSANRGEHIKFLLKLNNRKLLTRSSPIINFLIILKRTNHS